MQERKPSWFCRACQDQFHIYCPNPGYCSLDTAELGFTFEPGVGGDNPGEKRSSEHEKSIRKILN